MGSEDRKVVACQSGWKKAFAEGSCVVAVVLLKYYGNLSFKYWPPKGFVTGEIILWTPKGNLYLLLQPTRCGGKDYRGWVEGMCRMHRCIFSLSLGVSSRVAEMSSFSLKICLSLSHDTVDV